MNYGSCLTEGHLGEFAQARYALGKIVQIHEDVVIGHIMSNFKGLGEKIFTV